MFLVSCIAVSVGFAKPAHAFSLYGANIFWHSNHSPTSYSTPCGTKSAADYVPCAPQVVTFPGGPIDGHEGWEPTWDGNLREAEFLFNAFAVAPDGLHIFFRYRDGGSCLPMCATADFGGVAMTGDRFNYCSNCTNVLGLTQLSYYADGEICCADVSISTNPAVPWALGAPPTSSQISLTQTIMHELGHAAGLRHPVLGPRSGVLMECYQALGENQTTLAADDTNGLAYLYLGDRSHGGPVSSKC